MMTAPDGLFTYEVFLRIMKTLKSLGSGNNESDKHNISKLTMPGQDIHLIKQSNGRILYNEFQ